MFTTPSLFRLTVIALSMLALLFVGIIVRNGISGAPQVQHQQQQSAQLKKPETGLQRIQQHNPANPNLGGWLAIGILMSIYFLPAIVAGFRNHHNTAAILIFNLLLGWTLLGWIAALVWSATNPAVAKAN